MLPGKMASREPGHPAEIIISTRSAEQTRQLAARLAALLRAGDFIALIGPLGAGKTCFVQGLGEGLHVEGQVRSPTFVLMRIHKGPVPLCHADAYRLESAEELIDLGLDETVVALEWADRVSGALPAERIQVEISYEEEGRTLGIRGLGPRAAGIVGELKDERSRSRSSDLRG